MRSALMWPFQDKSGLLKVGFFFLAGFIIIVPLILVSVLVASTQPSYLSTPDSLSLSIFNEEAFRASMLAGVIQVVVYVGVLVLTGWYMFEYMTARMQSRSTVWIFKESSKSLVKKSSKMLLVITILNFPLSLVLTLTMYLLLAITGPSLFLQLMLGRSVPLVLLVCGFLIVLAAVFSAWYFYVVMPSILRMIKMQDFGEAFHVGLARGKIKKLGSVYHVAVAKTIALLIGTLLGSFILIAVFSALKITFIASILNLVTMVFFVYILVFVIPVYFAGLYGGMK